MAAKRSPRAKPAPQPSPRARTPRASAAPELRTVSWWDDFYRVIRLIPPGRVTTYGVVAALGGHPRSARHVGFALAALGHSKKMREVPWQRVLGTASGHRAHVAIRDPVGGAIQRAMLEAEGVTFDARGRVDLEIFGWAGPEPKPRRTARSSTRGKRIG